MRVRPSVIESTAVFGFFALGIFLRTWHLDREAVEHFDEGIYASVLWHDGTFNAPYPAREFYSPPLFPMLIEMASFVPGLSRYAPFLPAVVLGSLTVPAFWWLARSWFGRAAGIFIAGVVSMSDFHVIYSRMAVTDVPCLLWIVASVYFGTLAVQNRSFRIAIVAGVSCGLAWWTKYTGWLPLAIVFSGTVVWWGCVGRRSVSAVRTLLLLATMLSVTLLTFAPWWWQLQTAGGYSAVAANHLSYLQGFSVWSRHLTAQLAFQFRQDGLSGAISLGLGMMSAGLFRWIAAGGSTWNSERVDGTRGQMVGGVIVSTQSRVPSVFLLIRFIVAGFALTILALSIWTPLLLSCLAISGFGGMFLWPVLRRIWLRREAGDLSPTADGSMFLTMDDLESAPTIDPALGLCTTCTWFVGMLVTTPLYHPYARLSFPLLASIWLAAAGGISWWLESNVSVARRQRHVGTPASPKSWANHLVTALLIAAVVSSFLRRDKNEQLRFVSAGEVFQSSLFTDRTSIIDAANEAADLCVLGARGKLPRQHSMPLAAGETIRPEDVMASPELLPDRVLLTVEARRRERLVVYVFGEPALLMHLSRAGILATPVNHLQLGGPDGSPPSVPTFVIIGPNAKRTPGFWEQWLEHLNHFEPVGNVYYSPSEATKLDLFSLKWLKEHDEAAVQTFEVHRVL